MKILIMERSYVNFSIYDENNEINSCININPIDSRLFNEDIFSYNHSKKTVDVTYSNVRTSKCICGVLLLESNKTFGRTENKKRLLYKCIPDDKHLPIFLIPYDLKIGFIKKNKNKFILFHFHQWNQSSHPTGIITETIGDVDNLEAFYKYQLHSKSLFYSIKELHNKITNILPTNNLVECIGKNINLELIDQITNENEYLVNPYIFTVDPANSVDFDDAISITRIATNTCVTIYLANTFMILESLGLWSYLSDQISSIYLPDCRRPMLPSILSEKLCSLKQGENRYALAVKFVFDGNGNQILKETLIQTIVICVGQNFCYEDPKLLNNSHYKSLFDFTIKRDDSIKNSYQLIQYWMIHTNKYFSEFMMQHKTGIFRTSHVNKTLMHLKNTETRAVLQNWNNTGQYILYKDDETTSYCHITSPIRRIVDLLNQIMIYDKLFPNLISDTAITFLNKWTNRIEFINSSTKSIRKIQNESKLLNMCFGNNEIMNNKHNGILFERTFNEKTELYVYTVYMENLKLISKIKSKEKFENNTEHTFKIFLFENEERTKKKIKLSFLSFLPE